jgi:hypothetical protein
MTELLVNTREPLIATPRTERPTYGGEVAKLARLLGLEPMAHQRRFWDTALEREGEGFAFREICWTIPRQNGKSVALLLLMLWRCLRWPGQVVRYAAQSGLDARAKLADDWWPRLQHSPLAEVLSFRRQSGHEALIFENGSRLGLLAGTEKSGHGTTLDMAVLDESWALPDHRAEQSCRPAMATRRDAQLYIVSTAGTERRSPFLWEKVQAGRQAAEARIDHGVAFLEWAAPEDADPGDPATWRAAMPALGTTITEETVRGDFQGMPRHEFERSFLNRWTTSMGDPVIDLGVWEGLAEPAAPRPQELILGLDVSPRSRSAAIAAAGRVNGHLHVSVLEHGDGTDWVPARIQALSEQLGAEVIVDAKACAALLPQLDEVSPTEADGQDLATGCAFLVDLIGRGQLRHRGEPELLVALDGAAQRPLGDQWAWSRKSSSVDIAPLVASTLAVWGWHSSWGDDE